ncbi:MAG: GntR family transcriptional regulator [Gammaproteobacteria bacterium]|nr:GntR family transcriptional regulator [Gammaproteobacteria bacterium]
MAEAEERTLSTLRKMIIDGGLPAGKRLSEVVVADLLAVSRTPAKFALTRLEASGLIKKLPGRGYEVRKVRLQDLEQVLRLRGILEGAAAASMARNGLSEASRRRLNQSIAMTDGIVRKRRLVAEDIEIYRDANALFHETIMEQCGDEYILMAYESIRHLPLAALGTHVPDMDQLDREVLRLSVGHSQHSIIRQAIESGDAMRAELIMREHSNATLEYARLFVGEEVDAHIPTLISCA